MKLALANRAKALAVRKGFVTHSLYTRYTMNGPGMSGNVLSARGQCILCDCPIDQADSACSECVRRLVLFMSTSNTDVIDALWPVLRKKPKIGLSEENDSETHADLAVAYLEMDMIDDAAFEAVTAIRSQNTLDAPAHEALLVLLDKRVGGRKLLIDLRRVLRTRGWA